jgi:hypothetical protein
VIEPTGAEVNVRLHVTDEVSPLSGVVLDEPRARAIFYLAAREGFVDDRPSLGDGFVQRLWDDPPSPRLIDDALAQLVIGGHVLTTLWVPNEWETLERDRIIAPIRGASSDNTLIQEVFTVATPVLHRMMQERGHVWSLQELESRLHEFAAAFENWIRIAPMSPTGFEVLVALQGIRGNEIEEWPSAKKTAWERVKSAYHGIIPASYCARAYQEITRAAAQHSAFSGLPAAAVGDDVLPRADIDAAEQQVILQVAFRELRKVPIGRTLEETLEIASSKPADVLRSKLVEWTRMVRVMDGSFNSVLRDIRDAQRELEAAASLSVAGNWLTGFGVAVELVDVIVPFLGKALGLTASAAGVLLWGIGKDYQQRNQWAFVGNAP